MSLLRIFSHCDGSQPVQHMRLMPQSACFNHDFRHLVHTGTHHADLSVPTSFYQCLLFAAANICYSFCHRVAPIHLSARLIRISCSLPMNGANEFKYSFSCRIMALENFSSN